MAIQIKPVESSNVAGLGYDPVTKELEVQFRNGGRYRYGGIDAARAQAIENAPSVGKAVGALAREVKGVKVPT